jgi:hypothetical protein
MHVASVHQHRKTATLQRLLQEHAYSVLQLNTQTHDCSSEPANSLDAIHCSEWDWHWSVSLSQCRVESREVFMKQRIFIVFEEKDKGLNKLSNRQ